MEENKNTIIPGNIVRPYQSWYDEMNRHLDHALKMMKDRRHDTAGLGGAMQLIKDVKDSAPVPTPAPLTYTPAQVIEMVRKAWDNGRKCTEGDINLPELLTTLGLSVPGDKM